VSARLDPDLARVVSASRSRDLVHRCPEHLAAMLRGEADVKLGRWKQAERLDLGDCGALVLWTKQPAPIVECPELRSVLAGYVESGGTVVLQLTVTGLGGTPVEPGIPQPDEVASTLRGIVHAGLVEPRAVKLRYDPVGTIVFEGLPSYTNVDLERFGEVLDLFEPLGVRRVTASVLDDWNYPAVAERIASVGGRVERTRAGFMRELAAACRERAMVYSTCVHPDDGLVDVEGCIDGRVINGWGGRRVWDALHNDVGSQRPRCRCTYSLDIGSSPGVPLCSSGGFGCLYCYAQGAGLGGQVRERVEEMLSRERASRR
jgi:hypothetical protein